MRYSHPDLDNARVRASAARRKYGPPAPKQSPPVLLMELAAALAVAPKGVLEEARAIVAALTEDWVTPEAAVAAGIAVESIADVTLAVFLTMVLAVMVGVLFVLLIVTALTIALRTFVGKVWLVGKPLSNFCDAFQRGEKYMMFGAWHIIEKEARAFIHVLRAAFDAMAGAAGLVSAPWVNVRLEHIRHRFTQVNGEIHDLQHDLAGQKVPSLRKLWGAIHTLQHQRARLAHRVGTLESDLAGMHVPSLHKLWGAVHTLEHEQVRTHARLGTQADDIHKVQRAEHATNVRLHRAYGEIHHLQRRVFVMQKEIDRLKRAGAGHGGMTAHERHQLSVAFDFSQVLGPLLALAPLTAFRIDNLRKLEDNPCQCEPSPSVGGMDPIIPALVADFALKDGI